MKKQQGFTLIELLIVVAIIAVIAAIAVPNLLNARMAANETSAIAALRLVGSAQVAYMTTVGEYTSLNALASMGHIDDRFKSGGTISGYSITFAATGPSSQPSSVVFISGEGAYQADPVTPGSSGRYDYIMGPDFVVRYKSLVPTQNGINPGDPVGGRSGS